ncbi:hypothetical protein ACFLZR_00985, partial [Candidatus Neomarinimicrobiota bacterium]
ILADTHFDGFYGLWPGLSVQGGSGVLRLSGGMRWISGAPMMAGGFNISYGNWQVSYAYSYQSSDLGQPQMVSLGRLIP